MTTIGEVRNEEAKTLFKNNAMPIEKLTAKNIFSNKQELFITDPIDPKRISKKTTDCLNPSSVVKAVLVFAGTIGLYNLIKNTNILSYLGFGGKNSKDVNNGEITKVESGKNTITLKRNSETVEKANTSPINKFAQKYNDENKAVKFEEIKVEEFKDLPKGKEENVGMRRSINPTFKGSYDTNDALGITLSGNYAYVADGNSGLLIIDISNPSNPTFKSHYDTPGSVYGVALSGSYAYVADYNLGLWIIDISDLSKPTFKGSYDTPSFASGVALSGNYAYVADGLSGLQIIDISNPENPTFKGSCDTLGQAFGVAISGNYAYVAGGSSLQIIDISDPANPTFKGSYYTNYGASEVVLSDNYAYVAASAGLQIIDISDPSNPTFKGSYDTPGWAYAVALSENYAYVADFESGLQIIDISDPSNPTFKGLYDTPDHAYGVTVSGNYAYVADGASGLQIIAINILTDLDIALIVIGSIMGAVCISSFCCALIGGIVVFMRYRNKDKSTVGAKEQKSESKISGNDTQIVEYDLDSDGRKVPTVPEQREETELELIPNSIEDEISKIENVPDAPNDLEYDKEPPKSLCCPINSKLMNNPVILVENGQTYDRESIMTWLAKNGTDPLTGKEITNIKFAINYAIKRQVEEWVTKHKIKK